MVRDLAPDLDPPATRGDAAFDKGQPVGRIVKQPMPPLLRFQRDAKGRIRVDVDGGDRVHLQGDGQRHRFLPWMPGD